MLSAIKEFKANTVAVNEVIAVGDTVFKCVHNEFMSNDILDDRFVEVLSSFNGTELEAIVIAKLSYKLPMYKAVIATLDSYYAEKAKMYLAKTLINILVNAQVLKRTKDTKREFNESGKPVFRVVSSIVFNDVSEELSDTRLFRGVTRTPGIVLSQHIHTKVGGKSMKLSSNQKEFLREFSSRPLRLVKTPKSVLKAYYTQTEWYVKATEKRIEDPILLNARINKYVNVISALQQEENLYLSNWFDGRLRMYYELTLPGINPHGDSFETHQWEMAEPVVITNEGLKDLKWAAVVISCGRMPMAKALVKWIRNKQEIIEALSNSDEFDFGELFYNQRLLQAIEDAESKTPSHFMLGIDATTGGLQHFGAAFKSVKSMETSNVGGTEEVNDAHAAMGDAFGLDRQRAKKLNTPLLHGSSFKTISDILKTVDGVELSTAEVTEKVMQAYGNEIINVVKIADWGTIAYDNQNSSLLYTAPDGMKCQSTCYSESVANKIYGIDLEHNKGYDSVTVHRDMPLLLTAKGEVVNEKTKIRGVYANITHTLDGSALRDIIRATTGRSLLVKHDKFYVCPNDINVVRHAYKGAILKEFNGDYYTKAMKEIISNRVGAEMPMPDLVYGQATEDMIIESHSYLMP